MDGVFDDCSEVFVVEGPGQVDQGPCGTREGDRPLHASVVPVHHTAVHNDELRPGVRRSRYPDLGLDRPEAVEFPEHTGRSPRDHRVDPGP